MPSVPRILQQRQRRRSKYSKTGHQAGLIAVFFLSIPIAFVFIFSALRYTNISRDLPSIQTLPALLEPPTGTYLEPTRLYDHNGDTTLFTLEHPLIDEQRYVNYTIEGSSEIPQILVDALVANLDPHFWSHPGVPIEWPIDSQDPSIAQRIVLDLLLWEEPPSREKDLRSALLAVQITNQYGREKIVEWYLNTAYFGDHLYGIHAASQVYFGKPVEEIEVHEAAALTSILQSPALNPIDAPNAVIEGQQAALEAMYNDGWINENQALKALQTPLIFNQSPYSDNPFENPFVRYVISQLEPMIDPALVERGGFHIITTLDVDIQSQVECVIQAQNRIYLQEDDNGSYNLQGCPAARMLPQAISEIQNIDIPPQTNVVVLEPQTGKVRAFAGDSSTWNLAANSPSSGTLITPFIYLTAFTRSYTPSTLVWDIPGSETSAGVENLDGIYHGPMRARTALANDYLSTTNQLLTSIGEENVSRTIAHFGLEPAANNLLPQGNPTTLLDIVHAYSAFVNGGRLIGKELTANGSTEIYPIAVEQVIDVSGYLWLAEEQPREIPVITPQLAYLIFDILKDETARWPSLGHPNKMEIGRPTAGKMGVVPGETYGWTLGYSSPYMVGVWMGSPQADTTTDIDIDISMDYADTAASIWHAIQRYTVQDEPIKPLEIPVGINNRNVCDPSGLLPTQDCPTIVNEVFIAGTEPTQPDNLYQAFQINRETGRLATVFTPPELIDEKVYLVVPPEAQEWALENDIPVPPETSDIIFRPSINQDAVISSPEMFENIHGDAVIRGTAAGDRFLSYRVQIGAGLNPQSWIQIETDQTSPVSGGVLTTWDTEGYSGLYAVQLVVVRDDQTVNTSTIQVTVDNQAPSLTILYPDEDQSVPYQAGDTMTFLAEAQDNVSIERIEFYLGERMLGEVTQQPYAVPWRMSPGDFSLKLIAYDLAGNSTEEVVNFQVDR